MKNAISVLLRTCGAGALALLISANASAGVVFRGAIDPEFGLGFTGLDYSGEAFFEVDQACLDSDANRSPSEECGSINLVSASITLTFTDSDDVSHLQVLNFYPDSVPSDPITQYYVRNNTLAGVDTNPFGPQFANLSPETYTGALFLELFTTFTGDSTLKTPHPQADLITAQCPFVEDSQVCTLDPDTETTGHTNPAAVTITQVPEPATVTLLLATMAAGWIVRRKRVGQH